MKFELEKHLGHYCRKELKDRYERIMANPDPTCHYVIPCPITDLGHDLYTTGRTDLEYVTDELIEAIVRGINVYDPKTQNIYQYGGGTHIKYGETGKTGKPVTKESPLLQEHNLSESSQCPPWLKGWHDGEQFFRDAFILGRQCSGVTII